MRHKISLIRKKNYKNVTREASTPKQLEFKIEFFIKGENLMKTLLRQNSFKAIFPKFKFNFCSKRKNEDSRVEVSNFKATSYAAFSKLLRTQKSSNLIIFK